MGQLTKVGQRTRSVTTASPQFIVRHFALDDRLYSATVATCEWSTSLILVWFARPAPGEPNEITLGVYRMGTSNQSPANWYLIVY